MAGKNWSTSITRADFETHPDYTDLEMYFSIEEFVFTGKNVAHVKAVITANYTLAQYLMAEFYSKKQNWYTLLEKPVDCSMSGGPIDGDAYDLLNRNCKHYALFVINSLISDGWNQPERQRPKIGIDPLPTLKKLKSKIWQGRNSQALRLQKQFEEEPFPQFEEKIETLRKTNQQQNLPKSAKDGFENFLTTLVREKESSGSSKSFNDFLEAIGLANVQHMYYRPITDLETDEGVSK